MFLAGRRFLFLRLLVREWRGRLLDHGLRQHLRAALLKLPELLNVARQDFILQLQVLDLERGLRRDLVLGRLVSHAVGRDHQRLDLVHGRVDRLHDFVNLLDVLHAHDLSAASGVGREQVQRE